MRVRKSSRSRDVGEQGIYCPVSEVRCIRRMGVFRGVTLTPVSSTGQAPALSHDGRGDFYALIHLMNL